MMSTVDTMTDWKDTHIKNTHERKGNSTKSHDNNGVSTSKNSLANSQIWQSCSINKFSLS